MVRADMGIGGHKGGGDRLRADMEIGSQSSGLSWKAQA